MKEKVIKRYVVKQLKKEFPDWRKLTRKEKKRLARETLKEALAIYDESMVNELALNELTGTPTPLSGIIRLDEMEGFIEKTTRCLLEFPLKRWGKHLHFGQMNLHGMS